MGFIFTLIYFFCEIMTLLVVLRVILSWTRTEYDNPLTGFIYMTTEPVLSPLRRVIPRFGRIDWSPVAAVIILRLIILILP